MTSQLFFFLFLTRQCKSRSRRLREWAYDRESSIGRLDKGLDEANARGWTVVSMKDDWKRIFASTRARGRHCYAINSVIVLARDD
jgi:hypothetical protein